LLNSIAILHIAPNSASIKFGAVNKIKNMGVEVISFSFIEPYKTKSVIKIFPQKNISIQNILFKAENERTLYSFLTLPEMILRCKSALADTM
jgi:hypothetical protein